MFLGLVLLLSGGLKAGAQETRSDAEERFREATGLVSAGDAVKAIAIYHDLTLAGWESASLYWNWAQAAAGRGAMGEALWALLRARELDPGDAATGREIERLRQAANLDAAELAPAPLAGLQRRARYFRLSLVALLLLAASLGLHGTARRWRAARWPVPAAWVTALAGVLVAIVFIAASFAAPTAVVVRRGVPLADAASPTATVLATLREGEVVPILAESGSYLRIQDSSGARGWVAIAEVWRLDRPPPPPP